jgi:putative flippase GtrA
MPRTDIIYTFIVSFLVGVFLLPVLKATGLWEKFPQYLLISLIALTPLVSLVGMFIVFQLGKRIPILWQFSKFALVGLLNTAIDFGVLNLLISTTGITSGPSLIPLNAFAFSAAVTNSYFWNRKWVFAGRRDGNFVLFFIITVIGVGINSSIVFLIATYMNPLFGPDRTLWVNFAKVLATGVSLFWNFLGYKLFVFRR